jgi:hypothetical protein
MKTKALQTLAGMGIASLVLAGAANAAGYTIYSTGDNTGYSSQAASGGTDGNFTLTTAPAGEGSSLVVTRPNTTNGNFPFFVSGKPVWTADTTTSQWISPKPLYQQGSSTLTDKPGLYAFTATFNLTGLSNGSSLLGFWVEDNNQEGIILNGNDLAGTGFGTQTSSSTTNSQSTWEQFTAPSSDLVNGINTITFQVYNIAGSTGNPVGLNAYWQVVPEPSPTIALSVGILGMAVLMLRKKRVS